MPESRYEWNLNSDVHPMKVNALLDAVTELGLSVRSVFDYQDLYSLAGSDRLLQAIVKQISIPLRKLLCDDEGDLFKTTIDNQLFPPLGGLKGLHHRLTNVIRSERQEYNLGYANGKRETVVVPESEHRIELGRLYGVEFLEDGACKMHTPFDRGTSPIPIEDWLAARVLQINSVSYTIRDTLALVANFEGAHTNDLTPWMAVGVNPDDIDKGGRKKARLMNVVRFGCLSYAHLLVLYTGLYITRQMWTLLAGPDATPAGLNSDVVEKLTRGIPDDVTLKGQIVSVAHPMIVVGKSNVPEPRRRSPAYRFWSGSRDWDRVL